MARNSVARSPVPTAKPVTPTPQQKLTTVLDAAHLAIERLDSVIMVVVTALYDQGADLDSSLAICLENAVEVELNPARERIHDALALLPEVSSHG